MRRRISPLEKFVRKRRVEVVDLPFERTYFGPQYRHREQWEFTRRTKLECYLEASDKDRLLRVCHGMKKSGSEVLREQVLKWLDEHDPQ